MQQTDVRQKHRLMPPPIRSGGTISRMNNEKLMYGRALTGDVEKSVLKFDESRRPVVVVDATRDDALCVERSPADEERHRHRHCVKYTQHTHTHTHTHTHMHAAWIVSNFRKFRSRHRHLSACETASSPPRCRINRTAICWVTAVFQKHNTSQRWTYRVLCVQRISYLLISSHCEHVLMCLSTS